MSVNAIILTGGRSRRFGGDHKPSMPVGGRSTISRILESIRGLDANVVDTDSRGSVGDDTDVPRETDTGAGVEVWVVGPLDGLSDAERADVREVREEPPFSGPLAGIAAAATISTNRTGDVTLVLAGDMPMVTTGHLGELVRTCRETGRPATGTDDRGKIQFLCAAWPAELLTARLAEISDPTDGAVKLLFRGLEPAVVKVDPAVVRDFDTAAELEEIRARLR